MTVIESENKDFKTAAAMDVDEPTSASYYFDSYSHFGIHEEMLKDTVRTRTYMKSIVDNPHLFKGKVVLDVGCGTGILSMFAAKAGAKHVIGIDCAGIVHQAREIIKANNFDNVITIIQGKVEEIKLPVDTVDIIISEWMGYFLLYESMLDTVLFARDKWLSKDGLIFPDRATIYACAIEDAEYKHEKIGFWQNVYGFDMSCIQSLALTEPLVDCVESAAVISNVVPVFNIDIMTITKEELDFSAPFQLQMTQDETCHALVFFFSVTFSPCKGELGFSTGPMDKYTHWKQTVFYLDDDVVVRKGETMEARINVRRNAKNPRDLDITLASSYQDRANKVQQEREYRLR